MTELPQGWAMTTVGRVCEPSQYGWTTSASSESNGALQFLRTTDITKGPINWTTVPHCTEEPPNPEKYRLFSGDIVVSRAGSVGFSALLENVPPAVFASYLIRFRPRSCVNSRYLAWFLQSPSYWDQIGKAAAGVALANVNAKKLSAVELPLAPLAEQQRIVNRIEEQVSRLDAGMASVASAERKLVQMRAAILEAAVGARLSDNWETVTVGDIAEVSGGITKNPKRRPASNAVPFLRVANVPRDGLDLADVHQIEVFDGELERLRLQVGDLLVVEGNGSPDQIGRSALWNGEIDPCVHQNHLIRVRPSDRVSPEYLNLYWNAPSTMALIRGVASSTSGLYTLSTGKVKSIPLVLPDLDTQQRIVLEARRQLQLAAELTEKLVQLRKRIERCRAAVLLSAFAGRLVEQDASDTPAELLLETTPSIVRATKPGRRGRERQEVTT